MPSSGFGQAVTIFAKSRKNAAIMPKPLWRALCVKSMKYADRPFSLINSIVCILMFCIGLVGLLSGYTVSPSRNAQIYQGQSGTIIAILFLVLSISFLNEEVAKYKGKYTPRLAKASHYFRIVTVVPGIFLSLYLKGG